MIQNVTLTNANTEYSVALPAGSKSYSVQCRTAYDVRFSDVIGKVAAPADPFVTIKSGSSYNSPPHTDLNDALLTLYFASAQAGVVVEVVSYK
jgi:hypothetical protein